MAKAVCLIKQKGDEHRLCDEGGREQCSQTEDENAQYRSNP